MSFDKLYIFSFHPFRDLSGILCLLTAMGCQEMRNGPINVSEES